MTKNNNKIFLSKVTLKDEKLLYRWSNEKSVRKWSLNKSLISFSDHQKWFQKNLNKKNFYIWKLNYNSNFCGLIRIELIKKNYKLSYLISKKFRGIKLGEKMIKLALKKIRKEKKVSVIMAKSFIGNTASNRTLRNSGFKFIKKISNLNYYIFKNNK